MSISDRTLYYAHPADLLTSGITVTTTGAADSAYPLANAVDFSYAKLASPAKLTGTSGRITFDMGAATRVDGVLLWHNFQQGLAGAFQAHSSNSWGTPTLSTALAVPAKRADGRTEKVFIDLRAVAGYSGSGLRYYSLNISGTNDVALGVKVLFIRQLREIARDIEWGFELIEHQVGIDMTTDAMHPWAYELGAVQVLSGEGLWSEADDRKWTEFHRACSGRAKIAPLILEPSSGTGELVRWAEGPAAVVSPAIVVSRASSAIRYADGRARRIAFETITAGDPEWV